MHAHATPAPVSSDLLPLHLSRPSPSLSPTPRGPQVRLADAKYKDRWAIRRPHQIRTKRARKKKTSLRRKPTPGALKDLGVFADPQLVEWLAAGGSREDYVPTPKEAEEEEYVDEGAEEAAGEGGEAPAPKGGPAAA